MAEWRKAKTEVSPSVSCPLSSVHWQQPPLIPLSFTGHHARERVRDAGGVEEEQEVFQV